MSFSLARAAVSCPWLIRCLLPRELYLITSTCSCWLWLRSPCSAYSSLSLSHSFVTHRSLSAFFFNISAQKSCVRVTIGALLLSHKTVQWASYFSFLYKRPLLRGRVTTSVRKKKKLFCGLENSASKEPPLTVVMGNRCRKLLNFYKNPWCLLLAELRKLHKEEKVVTFARTIFRLNY